MPKILQSSNEIIIDSLVKHHRIIKAMQQIRDDSRIEMMKTNGRGMVQRREAYLQQWLNLAQQSVKSMAQIQAQMDNDRNELMRVQTMEAVNEWCKADDQRLPALEQRVVDTLIIIADDGKYAPNGRRRYVLPVKTSGNLNPRDINLYQLNRYIVSNVNVKPTRLKIIISPIDGERIYVEADTKSMIGKYEMYDAMYDYVKQHVQYNLSGPGDDNFEPTDGMDFQMLQIK